MKQKYTILVTKTAQQINKMPKSKKKIIWTAHETHLGGIFGGIVAHIISDVYTHVIKPCVE